jgi:hypothetical protein
LRAIFAHPPQESTPTGCQGKIASPPPLQTDGCVLSGSFCSRPGLENWWLIFLVSGRIFGLAGGFATEIRMRAEIGRASCWREEERAGRGRKEEFTGFF